MLSSNTASIWNSCLAQGLLILVVHCLADMSACLQIKLNNTLPYLVSNIVEILEVCATPFPLSLTLYLSWQDLLKSGKPEWTPFLLPHGPIGAKIILTSEYAHRTELCQSCHGYTCSLFYS